MLLFLLWYIAADAQRLRHLSLRKWLGLKGLMSYVGWEDMKSALRYVDARNSFGCLAAHNTAEIEQDR